jgi:hypothetical protein
MVAAIGHGEAIAWAGWPAVDVAVVDAADERRSGDQFPGVAVVRRVRESTAAAARRPLIVVVTGHSLHDGLRHRMAKAEADLFFSRNEIDSVGTLVDVLLHPENWRRQVPPPGELPSLGIARADVERLIEYVESEGLAGALGPESPVRPDPRSRRWLRHRRAMAKAAGIEPVNITTGNRPMEWEAPSIRQLSRVWQWAARVRRPGPR